MKVRHLLVMAMLLGAAMSVCQATVISGTINALQESYSIFFWGDGYHNLFQQWTDHSADSGWFYGSYADTSNADVYVYAGLTDPTTISDADTFPYVDSSELVASEGDTVFFRGVNGYYGAWTIDDIYPSVVNIPNRTYDSEFALNGRFYFVDDQTGNFTPEPATLLFIAIGAVTLLRRR